MADGSKWLMADGSKWLMATQWLMADGSDFHSCPAAAISHQLTRWQ
jgi:hypothetical protein